MQEFFDAIVAEYPNAVVSFLMCHHGRSIGVTVLMDIDVGQMAFEGALSIQAASDPWAWKKFTRGALHKCKNPV